MEDQSIASLKTITREAVPLYPDVLFILPKVEARYMVVLRYRSNDYALHGYFNLKLIRVGILGMQPCLKARNFLKMLFRGLENRTLLIK